MPRPIQARIDLAALRHNYLAAKKRVVAHRSSAKAWAVIKADPYGHGLLRSAKALADSVKARGVATRCSSAGASSAMSSRRSRSAGR